MTRHKAKKQPSSHRGFTLIELMIVVVIMGVLATLAIYGVQRYISRSKTAEAREIVGNIMAAQDAYKGEVGRYLDVTGTLSNSAFYPYDPTFDGTKKIQWGGSDSCDVSGTPCIQNFNALGVVVNSPVMFRYSATTLDAGDPPSGGTYAPNFNSDGVTAPDDGFVVMGVSDLEGSGDSEYTTVIGTSLQAALHLENVGE